MRRSRAWLVNFGVLGASLMVGLGLAEAALRLAGVAYAFPWTFDRHVGLTLRAGSEGIYREEGEAHFRINCQGLRDAEHAIPKPPGVLRIAVLGDSFTEALLLAMRDEAGTHGAEFWPVTLSVGWQVHPDPAVRRKRMQTLGVDTAFYPESGSKRSRRGTA